MVDRIIAIVLAAALLGGVVYHFFEVGALKADVKSKAAAIVDLQRDKAGLVGENAALHGANDNFAKTVEEQNKSIAALKAERDQADARYLAAKAKADAAARQYADNIAAISAFTAKAGETWCAAWERLMDGYFQKRHVPKLSGGQGNG